MTTRRYASVKQRHPTVKVLDSRIVKARVEHTLRCGCRLKPGYYYHRAVCLVNGSFVFAKQHTIKCCLERVH